MKTPITVICTLTSALAMALLAAGCAHEVSHTKTTTVHSNGTVDAKEKIITQSPDGTVTKTEKKSTSP